MTLSCPSEVLQCVLTLYSYSLVALPFLSLFLACDLTLEKSKWKPDLISLQGTTKVLPS